MERDGEWTVACRATSDAPAALVVVHLAPGDGLRLPAFSQEVIVRTGEACRCAAREDEDKGSDEHRLPVRCGHHGAPAPEMQEVDDANGPLRERDDDAPARVVVLCRMEKQIKTHPFFFPGPEMECASESASASHCGTCSHNHALVRPRAVVLESLSSDEQKDPIPAPPFCVSTDRRADRPFRRLTSPSPHPSAGYHV
jgi:hypothetical protein